MRGAEADNRVRLTGFLPTDSTLFFGGSRPQSLGRSVGYSSVLCIPKNMYIEEMGQDSGMGMISSSSTWMHIPMLLNVIPSDQGIALCAVHNPGKKSCAESLGKPQGCAWMPW